MNLYVFMMLVLGLMNLWLGYENIASGAGRVWVAWVANLPVGLLCLYIAMEAWK